MKLNKKHIENQHYTNCMGNFDILKDDFAQIARLVAKDSCEDLRLLLGRLVRKYREPMPDLAARIEEHLRTPRPRGGGILRGPTPASQSSDLPVDSDSRLSLIKEFDDREYLAPPLLPSQLQGRLTQIVREHSQADLLRANGIKATRSAMFVGQPGVGKTLAARWLAAQLQRPLWVLDLTAVMSSMLGKTGNNLRAVIDHAKNHHAILLLDEIDTIGKKRDDESDVGELKRLVTVLLQEIESWPDSGMLLAATNHPTLIDNALWRRFDAVLEFPAPDISLIIEAINRFLGPDQDFFKDYIGLMAQLLNGMSFSIIERYVTDIRRSRLLENLGAFDAIQPLICDRIGNIDKSARQKLATSLAKTTSLSQHEISRLTNVARATIRKRVHKSDN